MDVSEYADEHEGGQLRIACTGEQVPLLGLPDSAIPTTDAPQAVDFVRCRDVAELLGDPLAELTPAALETLEGQGKLLERVLGSDAAVAVGRFEPDGPSGYRARLGGPVRETRAEAEADELAALEPVAGELEPCPTCHGHGFQAGAHTERVEPCPTCGGDEPDDGPDFAELHRQRLEGQTTHRERLERKAEKRRDWADSRASKAATTDAAARAKMDVIPFGQPVHGARDRNYREKARRGLDRAHEHRKMAQNHERAADGLEGQLAGAIYSDDADAVERLEARIAELEAERGRWKAYNASCRRGAPDGSVLDEKQRANVVTLARVAPYQLGKRGEVAYTNLSANITRNRKRLEQLKRAAVTVAAGGRGYGRPMTSRFASSCAECVEPIEKGAEIVYYKLTREAVHAACDAR